MEFEHNEEEVPDVMLTPSYDHSLDNTNSKKMSQSSVVNNMDIFSQQMKLPKYKECLKNHAVGLGATAVDGCGEFMPGGEDGTLDALKCAACNCHRNFHRKETNPSPIEPQFGFHQPLLTQYPHHGTTHFSPPYFRGTPPGHPHVRPHQPLLLLPSSSSGGRFKDQEGDDGVSNLENSMGMSGSLKKRHRTKFSQVQKEKMLELAERLGWKLQKADDEIVQQFCNEFGIKRHVFKVWMHNNKHTIGKKEGTTPP
ncbi:hypothetical protein Leryth_015183 [Lithospermum erythrorhizon]|uniref:ZF-HD dimerization-type domain-containing protein n=1 Tax=Lithospermum erythrorhizon TaxID=34254 RepID=A0AAV3RP02_LITER|nr:hypothetical protein Leryth_015183 [Lithospermum erythrorhizon]